MKDLVLHKEDIEIVDFSSEELEKVDYHVEFTLKGFEDDILEHSFVSDFHMSEEQIIEEIYNNYDFGKEYTKG